MTDRRKLVEELRERAADPAKLHAHHHAVIEDRISKYRQARRRGVKGNTRYRRREAFKHAVWTLVGYLRQCHGWRRGSIGLGVEDLEQIHEDLHSPG